MNYIKVKQVFKNTFFLFGLMFFSFNSYADLSVVATVEDGTGPFSGDNNPGNDDGNANGIVRTNDVLNFCFEVAVNNSAETNVLIEVTTTPGTEFSLPPYCRTSGVTPLSSVTGDYTTGETAVCNVGNLANGTINLFCLPAKVHYTEDQGNTVGYTSSQISSDAWPVQSYGSANFTVSAAPMLDIDKQKASYRVYRRLGPAGEPGVVLVYPMVVKMVDGGKGQEVITSDLTITDNLGNVSPNARLWQGWAGAPPSACIPNRLSNSGFEYLNNPYAYINIANGGPGGPGGSSNIPNRSVANSGTFLTCSDSGPGSVANIVITGSDLTPIHRAIQNSSGSALPSDEIHLVSMLLRVWVPIQDVTDAGGSLVTSNTYDMTATTDSGAPNVDPDIANNTRNVTLNSGSGSCQLYYRQNAYTASPLLPGSASSRDGNGLISPGNKWKSMTRIVNTSLDPTNTLRNARVCATWDNTKHLLSQGVTGNYAEVRSIGTGNTPIVLGTIEYGNGSSGPGTQCDDASSPGGWHTNPSFVPGGVAGVTKVRVTQDLPAPAAGSTSHTYVDLHVFHEYKLPQPAFGTVFADYGMCSSDDFAPNERLSTYNENIPNGTLGDRATFTAVTVRVNKSEVSNITSELAGEDLDFELAWSATFPATPANPTTYTEIEDTLPEWYTYISGSANITPSSVTYNPDGTTTLKWVFPAAVINQVQTPITYSVNVVNSTPNNTDAINNVVISSPDDGSPLALRSDEWTVKVLNPALFAVNKSVIPQIIEKPGNVTWRLSYTNLANNPINGATMIDILPDTSTPIAPASSYNGVINFVSVSGANGETFEYSADPQTAISNNPDDPSNGPLGSTNWCANIGDPLPCPQVASDVTAIRITRSSTIPGLGGPYYIDVVEEVVNFEGLDTYTNEFCLGSDDLAITICANPVQAKVGLADLEIDKQITKFPAVVGDTVIYRLTVTNQGPDAATGVQVTDNLPIGLTYVTSAGVGNYDASTGIWDIGSVSPTAGSNVVSIDITAIANTGGTFQNFAEISNSNMLDPDSNTEDGYGVDEDGDGNPMDDDETEISFTMYPDVSLEKAGSPITSNPDGSFSITYTLTSTNIGASSLYDHMITDDLATEYGTYTASGTLTPGQYNVSTVTATIAADNAIAGDTLVAANTNYNGDTDQNLLLLSPTQFSRLGALDEVQVLFTVNFVPPAGKTSYLNQANATGDDEEDGAPGGAGNQYSDLSDDPSDNGGTDEDDPTPSEIPVQPEVGIGKSVATPIIDNGDGTFTANFTLNVENSGNVPLYDVQIEDNLTSTFGSFNSGTLSVGEYQIATAPAITTISAGSNLTLNAGYNGDSDINMLTLTSGDTLAVNGTASIIFGIKFIPDFNNAAITYENQATIKGDSTEDGTTTGEAVDDSHDGGDPDPEDDGPGNNSDPTPVPIVKDPEIGIAKAVSNVVNNGDGTWSATYNFVVENSGNIALHDINLVDDLAARFGTFESVNSNIDAAGEYGLTGTPIITTNSANPLTPSTGFNGSSDKKVFDLTAGGFMMAGETVEVEFVVLFYPDTSVTSYQNTATISGDETSDGNPDGDATDDSHDGTDPDPDSDGPGDNSDPTIFNISINPAVDLEKSASVVTDNNDGTYSVTYTLKAQNTGDTTLFDVQITDDISAGFGTYSTGAPSGAGEYTITPLNSGSLTFTTDAAITGDSLTIDSSYTGTGANTTLLTLTSGDSFGVGDIIEIPIVITFTPKSGLTYENQAEIEGDSSENGSTDGDVSDLSDDPVDNPGSDEDDPTPITVPITSEIDLKKTASWTVPVGDGTYNTTFTLVAKNTGSVTLYDVQISDDVSAGLGTYVSGVPSAPGEFTVVPLTTGSMFFSNDANPTGNSLTLDTSFNGNTNTDLLVLSSGDSLGVNDEVTIQFIVRFFPDKSVSGPSYENQALAEGDEDEDGTTDGDANDLSDDPTDNPGTDEDDPTPIYTPSAPDVGLLKTVSPVTDNGDGTFTATYTVSATNLGNVPLYDTQITDTITTAFGTYVAATPTNAGEYTITPLVAGDLAFNPNATPAVNTLTLDTTFNGTPAANTLLTLTSGDSLGVGDTVDINIVITWIPDLDPATAPTYENQAIVEGDEVEDGTTDGDVDDLSDDPADNPGVDEDDSTPVATPITPELDVEKSVVSSIDNGNGTWTVTFSIETENTGNVTLYDNQITDDLTTGFGTYTAAAPTAPGEYSITPLNAGSLSFVTDAAPTGNSITINPAYNGSTDKNLLTLTSGDSLSVGDKIGITLVMTFYPDLTSTLTRENQALAEGDTFENGTTDGDAEDLSDDPVDNPGADEDDPTEVPITLSSGIKTTKSASTVADNGDGTYTVTFDIAVENTGNIPLYDFQITDDIATGFGSYQTTLNNVGQYTIKPLVQSDLVFTTDAIPTGNTLTIDTGFTGAGGNVEMIDLTAGDSLGVGDIVNIPVEVTYRPDWNNQTSWENQAVAEGDHVENGTTDGDTEDDSDDPADNPTTDEDDPTPAPPPINSSISTTKSVGPVVDNGDGTFSTVFTIEVENTGNIPLYDFQILDDMTTGFGTYVNTTPNSLGTYTIVPLTQSDLFWVTDAPVVGNSLTVNTTFTGSSPNHNMITLTPGDSLGVGDKIQIPIAVTIYPDKNNPALTSENQADAQGDHSENGTTDGDAEDLSDDPADNPGTDEDDPTPVEYPVGGQVGTTKQVSAGPTHLGQGIFEVEFTIKAKNTGNVPLYDFQMTDDLTVGFGTFSATTPTAPGQYTVVPLTSSNFVFTDNPVPTANTLTVNTSFNGDSDKKFLVLTSGDSIGVDDEIEVKFKIHVFPDPNSTTLTNDNSVLTEGDIIEDGTTDGDVTDISDDPTDPTNVDTDGDSDADDPAHVDFPLFSDLQLTKKVNRTQVAVGEAVIWTIELANNGTILTPVVNVVDNLPLGFSYIPNSSLVQGMSLEPSVNGLDLTWTLNPVLPQTKVIITFATRITPSAAIGTSVNLVGADDGKNPVASQANAAIEIIPDHVFDCPDIIGKVFFDINLDGYPNAGEKGVPGANVYTLNGLKVTSDYHGRFHIACPLIPNAVRGTNFALKLDEDSTPFGYYVTSENPRVKRLTRAKVIEYNFGIGKYQTLEVILKDINFKDCSETPTQATIDYIDELLRMLKDKRSNVKITYKSEYADKKMVGMRVSNFVTELQSRWNGIGREYELAIDSRSEVKKDGKSCKKSREIAAAKDPCQKYYVFPKSNLKTIWFEHDQVNESENFYNTINELSSLIDDHKDKISKVVVTGHTSTVGSSPYNKELSWNRAHKVTNALLENTELDRSKFVRRGAGEKEVLVPERTDEHRALNRRTEVYVELDQHVPEQCREIDPKSFIIYFDTDKFDLDDGDLKIIGRAIREYQKGSNRVILRSYADTRNNKEYNKNLAQRRLESVEDRLVHRLKGINIKKAEAYGEEDLPIETSDEMKENRNRIVKIIVY